MEKNVLVRNPLFWITLSVPFVLFATIPLLPTYDDWGATPGPNPNPFTWSLLLPRHSYWRVPENLYGYAIAHWQWLMPWLPHVLVITAHFVGCCMVYTLCRRLRLSVIAGNMATVFYWVTTGAIATTTACDGMSQAWVQTMGLIALNSYLKHQEDKHNYSWLVLVVLATFVKENGLCWGVAIPVVGYAFGFADRTRTVRWMTYGIAFAMLYTVVHFVVPTDENYSLNPIYYDFSVLRFLRGLALLFTFTWLPLDYTHLLHAPHRNLLWVAASAVTALPFIYVLFVKQMRRMREARIIGLILAYFIVVGPHLVTIFSLMHTYASLGIAALIVGCFADNAAAGRRLLCGTFAAYVATCVVVNALHCRAAYDSGQKGRQLSLEAIRQVGKPVNKAFLIAVDSGETRYSNFYVLPWETFDYGNGILWENKYAWPDTLDSEVLKAGAFSKAAKVDSLMQAGYDCVWVLDKERIETYRN